MMTVSLQTAALPFFLLTLAAGAAAQPTGSLRLSTYLGEESYESAGAAVYDAEGDLWVCGGEVGDIFVVRIEVEEDDFGDRSYAVADRAKFGGSGIDACRVLFLAPGGRIYFGGTTESADFPMLNSPLSNEQEHILLGELGTDSDGNVQLLRAAAVGVNGEGTAYWTDIKPLVAADGSLKIYVSGAAYGLSEGATMNLGPFVVVPLDVQRGILLRLSDELVPERGFGFGESGVPSSSGQLILGDASACEELAGGPVASGPDDDLGCFLGQTGADSIFGATNPAPGTQSAFAASFSTRNMVPFQARFLPAMVGEERHFPFLAAGGRPIAGADGPNGPERTPSFTTAILQDAEQVSSVALTTLDGRVLWRADRSLFTGAAEMRDGTLVIATLGVDDSQARAYVCESADRRGLQVQCSMIAEQPSAGAGTYFRVAGGNDGPATLIFGAGDGLETTANAPQPTFGGGAVDLGIFHWDSPELIGATNAAFNGGLSPGDLATIFGTRLGPRKSLFVSAELAAGALPLSAGGLSVQVVRQDGQTLQARVLNASYGQASFEMPQELEPGERVELRFGNAAEERSNVFRMRLAEHDVAPFLFNGTEAIVQLADGSIATAANPLTPEAFAIVWFNSGHPKSPGCPGPGAVSSPAGDPLLGFSNQGSFRWELRAFTEQRQTVASGSFLYIGNSPGQLCAVGQANFQVSDAASWGTAEVQAALAEAARLEQDEPERYRAIRGRRPFVHVAAPDGLVQLELVITD